MVSDGGFTGKDSIAMCELYVAGKKSDLCPACGRTHEMRLLEIPPAGTYPWEGDPKFRWFFCDETNSMFTEENVGNYRKEVCEPECLPEDYYEPGCGPDEWIAHREYERIGYVEFPGGQVIRDRACDDDSDCFDQECYVYDGGACCDDEDDEILRPERIGNDRPFTVSIARFRYGMLAGIQKKVFSTYDSAFEWMTDHAFFLGENPYFNEKVEKQFSGNWVCLKNRPEDFLIGEIVPADKQTGDLQADRKKAVETDAGQPRPNMNYDSCLL